MGNSEEPSQEPLRESVQESSLQEPSQELLEEVPQEPSQELLEELPQEPSQEPAENIIDIDFDVLLKHLSKGWTNFKMSRNNRDFKTSIKYFDDFSKSINQLITNWEGSQKAIVNALQVEQNHIKSNAYPLELENALKEAGVPIRGKFPNYDFPPFNLKIDLENYTVTLKMGRKTFGDEFKQIFEPSKIAEWVSKQYKRVVMTKFNIEQFCKELFSTYEILNRLSLHKSEITWGHPVPLKEIYKLLTVKTFAKAEYPESLFIYDLARLKEQFPIYHESHRFELVPSRSSSSGFLLVNSNGQESRVSDLAIYEKGN